MEKIQVESIIKPTVIYKQTSVNFKIDEPFLEQIKRYMDYAGFDSIDDFFTKSADFVMKKDKKFCKIK